MRRVQNRYEEQTSVPATSRRRLIAIARQSTARGYARFVQMGLESLEPLLSRYGLVLKID